MMINIMLYDLFFYLHNTYAGSHKTQLNSWVGIQLNAFFFALSREIILENGLLMLIQIDSRRKEEFRFKWKGITPCS